MHPDIVEQNRTVYTFWDVMGDLGGLYDALKLLVGIFVSITSTLTGSSLSRFLISKIFKFDRKKKRSTVEENPLTQIKKRKPAKFSACRWLLQRKEKNLSRMFD